LDGLQNGLRLNGANDNLLLIVSTLLGMDKQAAIRRAERLRPTVSMEPGMYQPA
jgi:hypothetical protein